MTIHTTIKKLRTDAKLSQEQFASLFGVSQQSVQKWESGDTVPDLGKIIRICKHFSVSLDALVLGNDMRVVEELKGSKKLAPQYANVHDWEFYASNLVTEYNQCVEEGLDITRYRDLFMTVAHLPQDEIKKKLGDVLFEIVMNAPQKADYPYLEPSDLTGIQARRQPHSYQKNTTASTESKIHGAWMGRVCGCLLGKPFEGARSYHMIPFFKAVDNYPMHRYATTGDIAAYPAYHPGWPLSDQVVGMPVDDDTNYTVLYQEVVERYGRNFTPFDISRAWLEYQKKDAYCTAERVAFCNFVKGFVPPDSAQYKNPYREWIGAQIRGDYFGYINPGDPETAADMAWRDASVSHVKNGIYGEMWVAAMLAVAAETTHMEDIILGGLAQIPYTSRLYAAIMEIVRLWRSGASCDDCFRYIHTQYNEDSGHDWCHTISNAMIVAAALLYGEGNFGSSIGLAVQTGFDTDCNGATVGSIVGMAYGIDCIDSQWTDPVNDTLYTSIFGIDKVKISERARMTLKHLPK